MDRQAYESTSVHRLTHSEVTSVARQPQGKKKLFSAPHLWKAISPPIACRTHPRNRISTTHPPLTMSRHARPKSRPEMKSYPKIYVCSAHFGKYFGNTFCGNTISV